MCAVADESDYFQLRRDSRGDVYVTSDDEVVVVAIDANSEVLLAVEPSPAFGDEVVVLPGGTLGADEDQRERANLELREEVGYQAGRLDFLGELRPWSKYLAVRTFVYLGRDLKPSLLPGDEDYAIGILRVPLRTFATLIASGRLRDARVIAALYLARAFLDAEGRHTEGPSAESNR